MEVQAYWQRGAARGCHFPEDFKPMVHNVVQSGSFPLLAWAGRMVCASLPPLRGCLLGRVSSLLLSILALCWVPAPSPGQRLAAGITRSQRAEFAFSVGFQKASYQEGTPAVSISLLPLGVLWT